MYVKSLTLRGFKSFASATSMRLEPGITCIVGPNGSGKSNVVDALAWVMGEQGAKSLRGGKMEDVIFAGTSGRAPARPRRGRADHRQHRRCPADRLHRGDDQADDVPQRWLDYAINGHSCRLLDVQELLSDSGIGREMHVIVGQGQLDAVLRATPEERRGFIEEAAGVLKHRKRKERALRKLEAMEANLTRVNDLTGEIRRQLGPLGRQAEAARRAAVIQADARDARLRLLADDLVQLDAARSSRRSPTRPRCASAAPRSRRRWPVSGPRVAVLEQEAAGAARGWPAPRSPGPPCPRCGSACAHRVPGRRAGAPARRGRAGGGAVRARPRGAARAGGQVREQEQALLAEIAEAGGPRPRRGRATGPRPRAPTPPRSSGSPAWSRAAADRREGLAKLAGQVGARRSRIEAGEAEIGRLRQSLEQSRSRAADAEREFADLEASVAGDEEGEEGLDTAHERAAAELEQAEADVGRWREAERAAEQRPLQRRGPPRGPRAEPAPQGRCRRAAGRGRPLPRHQRLVAALLRSSPATRPRSRRPWARPPTPSPWPTAEAAAGAVALLREDDAGRAVLLVGAAARPVEPADWPALPDGRAVGPRRRRPAPRPAPGDRPAAGRGSRWSTAPRPRRSADRAPATASPRSPRDGDVFGTGRRARRLRLRAEPDRGAGGGRRGPPAPVEAAARRGERLRFALPGARPAAPRGAEPVERALERLHESDARMAAVAERLGQLGSAARAAAGGVRAHRAGRRRRRARPGRDRAELTALQQRLDDAEAEPGEEEPSTDERDRLDAGRDGRPGRRDRAAAAAAHRRGARPGDGRAGRLPRVRRRGPSGRPRERRRRAPERRRREAAVAEAVREGARTPRRRSPPRWSWPPRRGRRRRRPHRA